MHILKVHKPTIITLQEVMLKEENIFKKMKMEEYKIISHKKDQSTILVKRDVPAKNINSKETKI